MPLISTADQQTLREEFQEMTRPVRLLFFTQTVGCETCLEARRILDELPALSDRIAIEEVNLVLEADRAALYGIEHAPSVALVYEEADRPGEWTDSRLRLVGAPSGYEFISLVHAVLLAGGAPSSLSEQSLGRLATVDRPVTIRVFSTPTCPHCPRAVRVAYEMAHANPQITAFGIEVSGFPDLVHRYRVNGVPKTVVNDEVEILGALPDDDFVEQALATLPPQD
jgi:glutaredoxin-like protein